MCINYFFKYIIILGCETYACAPGGQCIISKTGPTCVCPEGMVGNPFPGGACRRDVCGPGIPCEEPLTCVAGRCRQRCDGVVCGVGAACNEETGRCVCNAFFVGNPDLLCMPREYSNSIMNYLFTQKNEQFKCSEDIKKA